MPRRRRCWRCDERRRRSASSRREAGSTSTWRFSSSCATSRRWSPSAPTRATRASSRATSRRGSRRFAGADVRLGGRLRRPAAARGLPRPRRRRTRPTTGRCARPLQAWAEATAAPRSHRPRRRRAPALPRPRAGVRRDAGSPQRSRPRSASRRRWSAAGAEAGVRRVAGASVSPLRDVPRRRPVAHHRPRLARVLVIFALSRSSPACPTSSPATMPQRPPIDAQPAPLPLPPGVSLSEPRSRARSTKIVDGDTIDVTHRRQVGASALLRRRHAGARRPLLPRGHGPQHAAGRQDGAAAAGRPHRGRLRPLLRYVFLADGTSVDATLVAEGFGHAWREDGRYQDQIVALREAKRRPAESRLPLEVALGPSSTLARRSRLQVVGRSASSSQAASLS